MPVYSSSGKTKQFQSNPGAPNSDSSRSKTNTVDPDAPDANNSQSKTAEVNPDAPLAESGASCSRSANNPGGGPVTQTWIAPGPTAAILSAQNNLGSPLVAGTPITRLPGNTVTTAFAGTGMPTRRADGLVLQFANSGDSVRYVYQGPLVLPDWTVLTRGAWQPARTAVARASKRWFFIMRMLPHPGFADARVSSERPRTVAEG